MSEGSEELILAREQITRNYGFTPPDAFVADLIHYVDKGEETHWLRRIPTAEALAKTLRRRYGFEAPGEYVAALKAFVDDLERMREGKPE